MEETDNDVRVTKVKPRSLSASGDPPLAAAAMEAERLRGFTLVTRTSTSLSVSSMYHPENKINVWRQLFTQSLRGQKALPSRSTLRIEASTSTSILE